jgi:hypothetical protein
MEAATAEPPASTRRLLEVQERFPANVRGNVRDLDEAGVYAAETAGDNLAERLFPGWVTVRRRSGNGTETSLFGAFARPSRLISLASRRGNPSICLGAG